MAEGVRLHRTEQRTWRHLTREAGVMAEGRPLDVVVRRSKRPNGLS